MLDLWSNYSTHYACDYRLFVYAVFFSFLCFSFLFLFNHISTIFAHFLFFPNKIASFWLSHLNPCMLSINTTCMPYTLHLPCCYMLPLLITLIPHIHALYVDDLPPTSACMPIASGFICKTVITYTTCLLFFLLTICHATTLVKHLDRNTIHTIYYITYSNSL